MVDKLVPLFLTLSFSFLISYARTTEVSEMTAVKQINSEISATEVNFLEVNGSNKKRCLLCEEFASQAVYYLSQDKTQAEIIDALHQACFHLLSFDQQCKLLVDYYAPFFFVEIVLVDPEKFCTKTKFCEEMASIQLFRKHDLCDFCQSVISGIIIKLKDPVTQLKMINALLKVCNKLGRYTHQCKAVVLQYGPAILVNLEKFFEMVDICSYIHACKPKEFGNNLPKLELKDA